VTTICLLTRDLRLADNPALTLAAETGDDVVPLFVLDDGLLAAHPHPPNRLAYLTEALTDLRATLRRLGDDLVLRRGDTVAEVTALVDQTGASTVVMADDVTPRARRREIDLRASLAERGATLVTTPGITIVPADQLLTASGTPYQVFTPYWRVWQETPWRAPAPAPDRLRLPTGIDPGALPTADELLSNQPSASRIGGGEHAARARLDSWIDGDLADYAEGHDDPAGDRTSHLSADLHFGCLSPLEVADRCSGRPGGAAFVRQLCWRDFHHQALFHQPQIAWRDWRPRAWAPANRGTDHEALEAWRAGRTGIPIVDAGMRQLREEAWMHNRVRMIVASVLTKHLLIPWQEGARHFQAWLVDADVANNAANWQWVAGRGADTRPNRLLNPVRQGRKLDPSGHYVRRYVPELSAVGDRHIHEPWRLAPDVRARLDYPDPIVDLEVTAARFRYLVDQARPSA
jgi:deoxyribodipyrimidine photo-lyase